MRDWSKTKQELDEEISCLKEKIKKLEKSESERKEIEEALRESERRMKMALEGTDQGLWEWDILSRKVVYDENWQRIMNIPPEGRYVDMDKWLASMDADGRAAFEIKMTDYLAGRAKYYELVHRLQTENKDWKWIWTRGIATEKDASGIPLRMIGTYRDITKRRQQEERLQESESLYRIFINATSDMVFLKDELLHNIVVNKSMASFFGKPEEEIIGKSDFDLMPQFAAEKCKQTDLEALSRNSIFVSEEIIGDHVYETLKFPVELGHNKIGVGGFIREISERKHAENALRVSQQILEGIINAIPVRVFWKDKNLVFLGCNALFARDAGFTDPKDIIGKDDYQMVWCDQAELYRGDDRQVIESGCPKFFIEEPQKTPEGRIITLLTSKVPFRNSTGEIIGVLGTYMDITERKQADDEKRRLEERLNRAEKMEALGTLAGGVAHDLNNILGIVVGYAEMILDDVGKTNPLRPNLVKIMEGGERAAAIVQDLLTLARRGVSGKQVLNLNKVISDCRRSPEFDKLSSHHFDVKIKTDLEPDLMNISGSSVHLCKTLFNLVSNACEAMEKGGVLTIKTTSQYLDKPVQGYDQIREGDYVILSVSDTGEGINATDLKRIFEPFYTKKVMGRSGTGLGLAVVWGTVKDHHGYINVQSEEGKGSTFALYFPVTREGITTAPAATSISEYMGKGESILIVDDVKEQRDLATMMLKKLNYNVTSVSSGEEAITYLKEHPVDLMVLDMIMDPGMDGLDTYKSVLKIQPKQKAIIVSGFSESDRVIDAQFLGAGAYVKKPYVIEKLGMAVRKELNKTKTSASSPLQTVILNSDG